MLFKNDIYITKFDYDRIIQILGKYKQTSNIIDRNNLKKLRAELSKAKKIDSKKIPPDYITMNSVFEIKDLGEPGARILTLVFPDDADMEKGKISILSPVGTAVIGYREGDVIKWDVPAGEKYYQINKVLYQPEAAGDYHL